MIAGRVRPLREVDDDGFAEMVNRDIKGRSDMTEYNLLRMPENVVRWHRELVFVQKDIEFQMNECRLSNDPDELKNQRLLRMRTLLKHIHRSRKLAQYTMNEHHLLDTSDGFLLSGMHELEHVLADDRLDDAKHVLEAILDRIENRTKENN